MARGGFSTSNYLNGSLIRRDMPLSLACWGKTPSLPSATTTQRLISITDPPNTTEAISLYVSSGDDKVRSQYRNTIGGEAAATTAISTNTWHHFCGVFNSAASRSAFLDGGSKGTDTTSIGGISTVDTHSVGILEWSTDLQPWLGDIAEIAIWNTALSDTHVASLAKGYSPLFIRPKNLLAYHQGMLNGNAIDIVGGYTLTEVGTVTKTDHPPGIIYPEGMYIPTFAAAAPPAAGKAGFMTLLGVQ